jgi:hypothetical protein
MIPLQQVMPDALAAAVRKAPLTPEKIAFAWRVTVGPALDRATKVELRDKELHVRVLDASWQREVERAAGLIRTRLQLLLGENTVRGLTVVIA